MKRLILVFMLLALTVCTASAEGDNKVLGTSDGRYVFGQISGSSRDQFMLDVKTGCLWRLVVGKNTKNPFLFPVTYAVKTGKFQAGPEKNP